MAYIEESNIPEIRYFGYFKTKKMITSMAGTSATAGGVQIYGVGASATLGIYSGSGAPTVAAAQGSLYIRTDGTNASTSLYVNNDGNTSWIALRAV